MASRSGAAAYRMMLATNTDSMRRTAEQGPVDDIKVYASTHAANDEMKREKRLLSDVLQAPNGVVAERRRRDFSEATRNKVLLAARQQAEIRLRRSTTESGSAPSSSSDVPAAQLDAARLTVEELQQQRKALYSAGFEGEAEKVQTQLTQLRISTEKERNDVEQRLLKKHLTALEFSQKVQREGLCKEQARELAEAEEVWKNEIEDLTSSQTAAIQHFKLTITRAAALEEVELPTALQKHRFKPSKQLNTISESLSKLPDDLTHANASVRETKRKLIGKYQQVHTSEVDAWRETFLNAALGPEASSMLGQMLQAHQHEYDTTIERQRKKRYALKKQLEEASESMLASNRVSIYHLKESIKKEVDVRFNEASQIDAQVSEAGASPLLTRREAAGGASANVSVSAPGSFRGGSSLAASQRPVERLTSRSLQGEAVALAPAFSGGVGSRLQTETHGADEPECDDRLMAWVWLGRVQEILLELTKLGNVADPLRSDGTRILNPLLEHISDVLNEAARRRLAWVLDVHEILEMEVGEVRHEKACELYELLNRTVVPDDVNKESVYASLMLNADECRKAIEPAFIVFLGTRRCSQLMRALRASGALGGKMGPSASAGRRLKMEGRKLPLTNVRADGLIGTLRKHSIEHAVSVVDVMVAGLPLVYVNSAWEELTGYSSAEVIGHNCRLLQGVATEEIAVSQMVQAIREGRYVHVCVSNYRKDGSCFRNSLSLHPLFDEYGDFRYMIGVSSDAAAGKQVAQQLTFVRALIPTSCPSVPIKWPLSLSDAKQRQSQSYVRSTSPDHAALQRVFVSFTLILCVDNPYRWFRLAVQSPSVFSLYAASATGFELPAATGHSPCAPISHHQLVALSAEMAQLQGKALQQKVESVWRLMVGLHEESTPQAVAQPNGEDAPADTSSNGGSPLCSPNVGHQRERCGSRASSDVNTKLVHERLQQAERSVAESHWLNHLHSECMQLLKGAPIPGGSGRKTGSYSAGRASASNSTGRWSTLREQNERSRRQSASSSSTYKPSTALEALAAVLVPDPVAARAAVFTHLWPCYSVLDDSASFLTALVHWADRSTGSVAISDMMLPGAPLIYVNDSFAELTGYVKDEVLGHNCRFLQGPETEPVMVASIQACICQGVDCHVRLTNYRANGSSFINLLSLRPIHDSCGVLRFMIGLQSELHDHFHEPTIADAHVQYFVPSSSSSPRSAGTELDTASQRRIDWHQRLFTRLPKVMLVDSLEPVGLVQSKRIRRHFNPDAFVDEEDSDEEVQQTDDNDDDEEEEDSDEGASTNGFYVLGHDASVMEAADPVLLGHNPTPARMRKPASIASWRVRINLTGTKLDSKSGAYLAGNPGASLSPNRVRKATSASSKVSVAASRYSGAGLSSNDPYSSLGRSSTEFDGTIDLSWIMGVNWADGMSTTRAVELALSGEVLVPGVPWMLSGTAFVGQHQRMVDHLRSTDVASQPGLPDSKEAHEHTLALTRIMWLQPKARAHALSALLAEEAGTDALIAYIARACPRLSSDLDELIVAIRDALYAPDAPDDKTLLRVIHANATEQLLLGWAEFLSSDEHARLLAAEVPFKTEIEVPVGATQMKGLSAAQIKDLSQTLPGSSTASSSLSVQYRRRLCMQIHCLFGSSATQSSKETYKASTATSSQGTPDPGFKDRWLAFSNASSLDSKYPLLPIGTTWLTMISQATCQLPYAMCVVDMMVAGLPLVYVNRAWEELTGYSSAEVIGHNCRLLQGPETEESALAELVNSIRERRSCVVQLTNYKKATEGAAIGTKFVNELSLHPVFDSRGTYRYVIGIASNASDASEPVERAMLTAVRQLMPNQFPASFNPREERVIVDKAAQRNQFVNAMVPSVVQRLLRERERGVLRALSTTPALVAFWHYLNLHERHHLNEIHCFNASAIAALTSEPRDGSKPPTAASLVTSEVAADIVKFERKPFELFLNTTAGDVVAECLVEEPPERLLVQGRLWADYTVPMDAAGWLQAFAVLTEPMSSQFALSDMSMAGNPLIYVNDAWCETTGYSRDEVLGRNCRLLQGPASQVEAVRKMVTALRDGTDTCVRITNYRKSGETFDNLVVLRPVYDSNGVYRFCISMHLEVAGRLAPLIATSVIRLRGSAAELASLRNVMRSWSPRPISRVHRRTAHRQAPPHATAKPAEVETWLYESLDSHFLLHVLSPACKEALVGAMFETTIPAGQHVIKHGAPPTSIYMLYQGTCSLRDVNEVVVGIGSDCDVFGELAIIHGTPSNSSVVTDSECIFYVLEKERYSYLVSQIEPCATSSLLPPATVHVDWCEPVKEVEDRMLELMQSALHEADLTARGAQGVHAPSPLVAGNHDDMKEALNTLAVEQQLSVLRWLHQPSRSLQLLLQKQPVYTALQECVLRKGDLNTSRELGLILQLRSPNRKAAAILAEIEPDVEVAALATPEIDERLDAHATWLLGRHARGLLAEFLCSPENVQLLHAVDEKRTEPTGVEKPCGAATWLTMISQATCQLPYAMCVVDVMVAGLPLVYVNRAWEELTGYSSAEVIGHNCRLLQGPETEESALAELVNSIRERRSCVVQLTNYKKATEGAAIGTKFVNELSLHPVFDSRGTYRYVIGIASNASDASEPVERAMLTAVRQLMPDQFPMSLSDHARGESHVKAFDLLNNEYQYHETMEELIRVACLDDVRGGLEQVLQHPQGVKHVHDALLEEESRYRLQLLLRVRRMLEMEAPEQHEVAHSIYAEILMPAGGDSEYQDDGGDGRLVERLRDEHDAALRSLTQCFPSCLESKHVIDVLLEVHHDASFKTGSKSQMWPAWSARYTANGGMQLIAPVSGWLRAFVEMTGNLSLDISLSDMSMAGNPLIYVNDAWCETTGYSRDEVLGRNCRLLQGPASQVEAVRKMVTALRDGTDTCVRITNYRKSGETFDNLVALRPVHDSTGVYRFCICAQMKLGPEFALAKRLQVLAQVMNFMPSSISYCNTGVSTVTESVPNLHQLKSSQRAWHSLVKHALAYRRPRVDLAEELSEVPNETDLYTRICWSRRADPPFIRTLLAYGEDALHSWFADSFENNNIAFGAAAVSLQIAEAECESNAKAADEQFARAEEQREATTKRKINEIEERYQYEEQRLRRIQQQINERAEVKRRDVRARRELQRNAEVEAAQKMQATLATSVNRRSAQEQQAIEMTIHRATKEAERMREQREQASVALEAARQKARLTAVSSSRGTTALDTEHKSGAVQEVALAGSSNDSALQHHGERDGCEAAAAGAAKQHLKVDSQIEHMATRMGVAAPEAGPWLQMLCEVVEALPYAMLITDMRVPGLPIAYCNAAMVKLTGYDKGEIYGRNCRFLQGPRTEAVAVREMVVAIRTGMVTTVRVTNYRKDNSQFTNAVTMAPVHDHLGVYRYSIGILTDADEAIADLAALDVLRSSLPNKMQADAQPPAYDESLSNVDAEAQLAQHRAAVTAFTRLQWSADWNVSLAELLSSEAGVHTFSSWLLRESPEEIVDLELYLDWMPLSKQQLAVAGPLALQICQDRLNVAANDEAEACALLQEHAQKALASLSSGCFRRFVQFASSCNAYVRETMPPVTTLRARDDLLWSGYKVPQDVAGWVHAFVQVAEMHPACIVLSDMSIPGNPMVYVNREFCRVTEYGKHEAMGRNCRFLQGLKTEPQAVAVIRDTLRRGVDCHVKITNYRKGGELFENLLTMRPVHDSNGVYRFCIAVQYEVSKSTPMQDQISELDGLIKLLPASVDVSSKAVGATHRRAMIFEESKMALDQKLERAIAGDGSLAPYSFAAREEAALTIRSSFSLILDDTPFKTPNEIKHAREALQEVVVRLRGEVPSDPKSEKRGSDWAATAGFVQRYLDQGRAISMSSDAVAATRAVLEQLMAVNDQMLYAGNRSEMLEHLNSKTVALGSAPTSGWQRDAQVDKLATKMGVAAPEAGPWLQMLCEVVEALPYAMLITDMRVPGLPIAYCNAAMVKLTGYDKGEIYGRNCRFLQGPRTEAVAVREMVVAIRTGTLTTVRVTNYRKDNSQFTNAVTMAPVHDHLGVYRYSIGILTDADEAIADLAALDVLRSSLPNKMQANAQPPAYDESLSNVDAEAQLAQHRAAVTAFTRLQWSADWNVSLAELLSSEAGVHTFSSWLLRDSPAQFVELEMYQELSRVVKVPRSEAGSLAVGLCWSCFTLEPKDECSALSLIFGHLDRSIQALSGSGFRKYVQSSACSKYVQETMPPVTTLRARDDLLWSGYKVPQDVAGWVHAFVQVAEMHPACIVLSDMSIPGNPMVYVNREFCRVTEYGKHEAMGRNCRFLQGPKTEPQAVAVIRDTLRRGVDCHVKITNYRKGGELFENLLTMRPVHDSNGVYRFCIAVQYEVSKSAPIKEQLLELDGLIKLLPASVDVSSKAVGATHRRAVITEEATTALDVKLERAMAGDGALAAHSVVAREEAALKLQSNHSRVLRDVCNPGPLNIEDKPLTQLHLRRVAPKDELFADQALREIFKRLIGEGETAPTTQQQGVVWAATAEYLDGRLQATAAEKPGRAPDMSPAAAAAMRAVLKQLMAVNDQMLYAGNRSEMLEHLNSKTVAPGSAPTSGWQRDAQVDKLATKMGVAAPEAGPWLQMLCEVVEALPYAMLITDMRVPGLPIAYCNAAMVKLTGYDKGEIYGRNCRFLQGPRTEAVAVREMVVAIRTGTLTTVRVTNYRKDGSTFINAVTMAPVHDHLGVYRYSIGTLTDAADAISDGTVLDVLRSSLPNKMQADAQPPAYDESLSNVDAEAQLAQHRAAVTAFTRLQWSADWNVSLAELLSSEAGVHTFSSWLLRESPEEIVDLELYLDWMPLSKQQLAVAGPLALQICQDRLNVAANDEAEACALLQEHAQKALASLSSGCFRRFVQFASSCNAYVRETMPPVTTLRARDDLLWSGYKVPQDVAGWVHAFVQVAEMHPACIVLSDMSIPGNPMVYVNREFCRVTEYGKHEAMGRNCRFLQGLKTEPQAVAVIRDTLRRGVDCHVKITNYRKGGELFENLLTMRPVHDSNGVYRFCIAVQYEVSKSAPIKEQLLELDGLIKLLPASVDVSSKAVGATHRRAVITEEATTALDVKLERAMAGDGALAAHSVVAREEAALKLQSNHSRVLRDVCNPGPLNIEDKPLTQLHLRRVAPKDELFADQALREIFKRLIGEGETAPTTQQQGVVWAATAEYLDGRLQATAAEKPGRAPDMSPAAAAAMRAVLKQLMAVNDQMLYAGNRSEMLEHLNSKTVAPGSAPTSGWQRDAQVDKLATKMGVAAPEAGPWLQMLCEVVEALPYAMLITDMRVPGLPIAYCNAAMVKLTGYDKGEIYGRNCRFLQGPRTEAVAVREMVVAIRTGTLTTVRVTNYRKDGSTFINAVTMAPVHDSRGVYRYSIGILTDAAESFADAAALDVLRSSLPNKMQADAQPPAHDESLSNVDAEAQLAQHRAAVAAFTRLQWSSRWEASLEELLSSEGGIQAFSSWLRLAVPEDLPFFQVATAGHCDQMNADVRNALIALSSSYRRFVQSAPACASFIKQTIDPIDIIYTREDLLWSGYKVPQDVAGWVHAFVQVAEMYPACIVLSDMSIPGNPMVYVNREFCRVTEYGKHEAMGRNCRFLQGPRTEPQAVAVIQDTLRRGVDCHVKITNYRKGGELFENLLTMRPVHDSNGVYRFCIAVQYEVSKSTPMQDQISELDGLIKLLPASVDVSSKAVGATHRRAVITEEATTALDVKLERAMAGDGALAAHSVEAREEAATTLQRCLNIVATDLCEQQSELATEDEQCVAEALQQVIVRLRGQGGAEPIVANHGMVWAATADLLDSQLESSAAEAPHLEMSAGAVAAMRAVLKQLKAVNDLFLYAGNRSEMLEHLNSRLLNTRAPSSHLGPTATWPRDAQVDKLATKMGVAAPEAGPWLQMLCEVVEALPYAMLITDMRVPGLPIAYCNAAMVKLTGYDKGEIYGRNCRFLQGPRTEAVAVREMVVAIRTGTLTTVRVTNYRKDGSTFINAVTMAPVHDSRGVYRYSIGVLVNAADSLSDGSALEMLRFELPQKLQADTQPPAYDESLSNVDAEAQLRQHRFAIAIFTRLKQCADFSLGLEQLAAHKVGHDAFLTWLQREAPDDVAHFELYVAWHPIAHLPASILGPRATELCKQYLGLVSASVEEVIDLVDSQAQTAFAILLSGSFRRFVRSTACLSMLEKMAPMPELLQTREDLLWSKYKVPQDVAGWVHAFASAAEMHPACIALSDMSIPGNPMIFVNREFCRVTEYGKHEAMGRNCRFLQGPKTEPQAVAVIRDTLRRGVDCHVKITNYRKGGELFENLLTLRPVHDSNGVYRFCIAVQYELDNLAVATEALGDLCTLLICLPKTLEVSSKAVGPTHHRAVITEEVLTPLEVKLERLMAGDGSLAAHGLRAREEAAEKLRGNIVRVRQDICNPGPTNIDGKPLSQAELRRLPSSVADEVDEVLREIACRLLGEEPCEPRTPQQGCIWVAVADYLDGRIQATAMEKPGRKPDMSSTAAAAMRAVLQDLKSVNDLILHAGNRAEMLEYMCVDTNVKVTSSRGGKLRRTATARETQLAAYTKERQDRADEAAELTLRCFPHLDERSVRAAPFQFLNSELEGFVTDLIGNITQFATSTHGVRLMRVLRTRLPAEKAQELYLHLPASAHRASKDAYETETKAKADGDEQNHVPEIYDLVRSMKVAMPAKGPWLQMLCEVVEALPYAMLITDMRVPGLPIAYCNAAMVKLTGYDKGEIYGRNCRFLQGPRTEAAAVREMVVAIRTGTLTTVRVTNYRKDGSTFINAVTMAPVHDSRGVYRYSIGILTDAAESFADAAALDVLRSSLPNKMQADAQPPAHDESLSNVDAEAQLAQHRAAVAAFTRLQWSSRWEASLEELLSHEGAVDAITSWLSTDAPDDVCAYEQLVALGCRSNSQLRQRTSTLAHGSFRRFVWSRHCVTFIEKTMVPVLAMRSRDDLLWSAYKVPKDISGWLHAFAAAAETHSVSIVVSDMSIPGNPMVFVNREFCRMTEYPAQEALGQNCRFLQGPRTQPAAISQIQDALRRGEDLHVQLTNYRKSGDLFDNLLSLRPLHDSNGVFRFCIAVQCEVPMRYPRKLEHPYYQKLKDTIMLLPRTIDVVSEPVGTAHGPKAASPIDSDQSAQLDAELELALEGPPEEEQYETYDATPLYGADRQQLLSDLARAKFASHFFWVGPLLSATIDDSVAVAVSDAQLPGFPLVMVNRAFEALTGFFAGEILGRNCRFLQCHNTEPDAVQQMVKALRSQQPCEVRITNQRKDGSLFINLLTLHPVLDSVTGIMRLVIATQREETTALLAGGRARADAAAVVAAIPRTMDFSEPALPKPCAAPTRTLEADASGSSSTGAAPMAQEGRGEKRDTYWVGSPLRHHVSALRKLLGMCSESLNGAQEVLGFVKSHWLKLGRITIEADEKPKDSVVDMRLSLHSRSVMPESSELLETIVGFCKEVEVLLSDRMVGSKASAESDSFSIKILDLYDRAVVFEGGARGVGKSSLKPMSRKSARRTSFWTMASGLRDWETRSRASRRSSQPSQAARSDARSDIASTVGKCESQVGDDDSSEEEES